MEAFLVFYTKREKRGSTPAKSTGNAFSRGKEGLSAASEGSWNREKKQNGGREKREELIIEDNSDVPKEFEGFRYSTGAQSEKNCPPLVK